ncbi:6878_t:CDS:2 [Gigaspora margarita]|uniref:6878_t:CDS:1 n=1 Tax=Gigaspora margarita TaxID=4874 RepID=A0ABN7VHU5_GIGMA|nr:6878_t:CDS:2 [Gigaspora margarita]
MAQDKSCQVVMCVKTGGSVAVAVGDGTSSGLSQAQIYISSECPGVTNTTSCYVDCKGPYADVCTLGGDPNYPFNTNTTTSTNSPAPQSNSNPAKPNTANSNPAQGNNCSYGSTCINNFHSQANQADTKFYFISRLLLVITILLCYLL